MTETIITSAAPDAKPVAISTTATTSWVTIVTVPQYQIPSSGYFGSGDATVPGVAEIITPLMCANTGSVTASISVRIVRDGGATSVLANALPVPPNDALALPLNGQFLLTDDVLQIKASANSAIDVTMSYTVGQAEQDDVI